VRWKNNTGLVISLIAWILISGHGYVPHHHHDQCVDNHQAHHHNEQSLEKQSTPQHDDLTCAVNTIFDKSHGKTVFIAPETVASVITIHTRIEVFQIFSEPLIRRLITTAFSLRGPPSVVS
jgi:uncharacterized protein YqhQ